MGSFKYFLGGDEFVAFQEPEICHGEKSETVYICNGIWTIVLVKHLTICLIKIIFFSHFAYCFGMIHLCLDSLFIETWQMYNCAFMSEI